ncbi:hypothetical protein ACIBKY_51595 [Nonomuraea sp. NPDC050394]|uniref:hypothetical protein n=1 Tax=Nonomuraea sp. NPDC050394 TaxID=3364363 RepID=UPI0037AC8D8D
MNETHCRRMAAQARTLACALLAAGEVFPTLLGYHRQYGDALVELADLADRSTGAQMQRRTRALTAMGHVLHEALRIRYADGLAAHAARLGITASEVEQRLHPPLPAEDADDDERAAYERSIYGRSALWHKLGITGLTGDDRHAAFQLIRLVWVSASSRADIEMFLKRLEALVYALRDSTTKV